MKRLPELDRLVQSAYGDKVMGRVPENLCVQLLNGYEVERAAKQERRKVLCELLSARREKEQSVDEWLNMMQDYRETNISNKNKKRIRKDPSEWVRVEGTHEAIISKDVFDRVQEQIATRRRSMKDQTTQIFSRLLKCAGCGWSMRFRTKRQIKKPYRHYDCSRYGQLGNQCSAHYVRYDVL